VDDLSRIIGSIPDLNPSKPEEASVMLFALSTGARAISAVNVKFKDMSWKGDILQTKI
jgi:hypothetical protein